MTTKKKFNFKLNKSIFTSNFSCIPNSTTFPKMRQRLPVIFSLLSVKLPLLPFTMKIKIEESEITLKEKSLEIVFN